MKIELVFNDVPEDIEGAIADIRIEDQSKADAPALILASIRSDPFTIRRSQPEMTLEADLSIPDDHEPSLFVRVNARTQSNQTIQFLNTTTVALSRNLDELVRMSLERIM